MKKTYTKPTLVPSAMLQEIAAVFISGAV